MKRYRWLIVLLLVLVVPVNAQGIVEQTQCIEAPFDYDVNCGYVTLPQDYDQPESKSVQLYYIQIESKANNPLPDPVVYLVGGPGSSGSQLMLGSFQVYLSAFAAERDIIIIDQRGTGLSQPSLNCPEAISRIDDILQSTVDTHADIVLDVLTECHDRLSGEGVAFETFHSANIARDVENILLSLGYQQWNLVGVSYGSRLALTMMRDQPERIRSAILDSVYPLQVDLYLDAYTNGERALRELFTACTNDTDCNSRYPDLETVFFDLYTDLNDHPLVGYVKPYNRPQLAIPISGYRLYDWIFTWLYAVPTIESIPRTIYELENGNINRVARYGATYEASFVTLSLGMHYTVQCQEEFISATERDYDSIVTLFPHLDGYMGYPVEGMRTVESLCGLWQAQPRDLTENAPVASDIPTLLLSGNFDPITPPEWADLASETLTQSYSFVLPYVGHGVLRSTDCAVAIAVAFVDDPTTEPDSSCIADTSPLVFD